MHVLWNPETAWSSFHQGKCNFARSLFLPFPVPWFNLCIYVCLFCTENQPPGHSEEFHKALATFTSGIGAHWVIIETPNVISRKPKGKRKGSFCLTFFLGCCFCHICGIAMHAAATAAAAAASLLGERGPILGIKTQKPSHTGSI